MCSGGGGSGCDSERVSMLASSLCSGVGVCVGVGVDVYVVVCVGVCAGGGSVCAAVMAGKAAASVWRVCCPRLLFASQ